MKIKKILFLLFSLLLVFLLAGCNNSKTNQEPPKQENPQSETPQKGSLKNGDYEAYSGADPDSKGDAKIKLQLKDGKIADVAIEEIQDGSTGHAKKDLASYPYKPAVEGAAYFKDKFAGLSTIDDVQSVDDFAGITSSSAKYKQAAGRALDKAGSEKTGTYFDGTFMGYSDTTEEKGFATAYVTIKNDAIASVILEEWAPDTEKVGSFKLKDYATYPLKEAKPANEYFTNKFVGATNPADIDAVDDFSGVTHSSANYKLAVKMALEKTAK